MRRLVLFISLLCGCASHQRYADRAILWHDPDDLPVPKPPARRDAEINWEGTRDAIFRPANRFFEADYLTEATNVNALDEVPDSTWFVNRRRDPKSPDDQPRFGHFPADVVEHGGVIEPGPTPPYTVLHEKDSGSSLGLVVLDARGTKYQLKFDPPGYPGLISALEVVATRLAWAAGWNVASEELVDLRRDDLQLSSDAWSTDRYDRHRPFSSDMLDGLFSHVAHHGIARAVASRWIEGEPLGWFSYYGKDKHDANDRVRHELRRDLRGFGVWASWVDDVDTFDNNTFDAYVGEPGQGHVIHYQQGVGASFGHFAAKPKEYWMGREPYFTPGSVFGSMLSLGLASRPWHDASLQKANAAALTEWPQFGFYDADHFDPRRWRPVADNPAFVRQTKRDRYWGAKQIVAFNEEEVRAAIRAGHLDPIAAEHLFDILWRRRARIAQVYFSDVSPLDRFTLHGDKLCFEDLWVTAGLGDENHTVYEAKREGRAAVVPLPVYERCAVVPRLSGYQVVTLRARRSSDRHPAPTVEVHLVDRGARRNIVGVVR